MTKIVRKIRPTDYWRIGEHEGWFSDRSLEGYHLHKMGTYFAHFKKGEPMQMEYRIEVTKNKSISDEQIDLYEENGWDYITSYQYFHVFASPKERYAAELHTDPAEQAYTLQHLNKRLILSVVGVAVGLALMVGMLSAVWFLDGTPVLRLVEGYIIQQSILSMIILYSMFYTMRAMLAIQALRRNLKEGKAIDHHAPWEKSLRNNQVFSVVFILIALTSALLPWIQLTKSETLTLPIEDTTLPFVRLADIEQNPKLIREEYMIDDVDWANRYSTNWNLFAPIQYEIDEQGVVEGSKWLDGSGTYSPSITSEVYELTFESFAAPLISDLVKWHSYDYENNPTKELNHPGFDRLIVREDAEKKELFALQGKTVMYVRYFGYADIERIIENVAEKIILVK